MAGNIERRVNSNNEGQMYHRVRKDLVLSKMTEYGANRSKVSGEKIIGFPQALAVVEEVSQHPHADAGDLVPAISNALVKVAIPEHKWFDLAGFAFFFFGRSELFAEHYEDFPRIPAGATVVAPTGKSTEVDEIRLDPAQVARDRFNMDAQSHDLFPAED